MADQRDQEYFKAVFGPRPPPAPAAMRPAGEKRLFISFAVADAELAQAFADFLRLGCDLAYEQVFLTARPGQLQPGENFNEAIREALNTASIAVLLLTPSYYESRFCLAEAGAVWASNKKRIPIVVPPIEYANLDGVQLGEQALKVDRSSSLDVMRDIIREVFGKEVPTAAWNDQKGAFLNLWTTKFDGNIAKATSVPATEIEEHKSAANRLRTAVADLEEERDRLRRYTRELAAQNEQLRELVPDAPPPPNFEDDENAQYLAEAAAAIDVAARHMSRLPAIACEAIFRHFLDGQPLTVGGQLDRFSVHVATQNVEQGYVDWFEDEAQAVTARKAQPDVDAAFSALTRVREAAFDGISMNARSEAGDWIKPFLKEKYDITDPTFELRPTWEKLGFL